MMIRTKYFMLSLLLMAIGYASRLFSKPGSIIYDNIGDGIWAAMIYLGFRFLLPQKTLQISVLCALVFSYCIEFSQFYHAEWIENIRATLLGGLVLGFGFLWSDLFMYSVGILIAYQIDKQVWK